MEFKFFIGCVSKDAVKVQYRTLAKVHHPDRGGKEADFKALYAEFSYITNTDLDYPIANIKRPTSFHSGASPRNSNPFWEEPFQGFDAFTRAAEFAKKQQQMRDEEAKRKYEEQKKREDKWYTKKERDMNYVLIENLIKEATNSERTVKWMLMEIYKLDELGLDHFKFIRETIIKISNGKAILTEDWITISYKNYIAVQEMEWRLQ